MTTKTQDVRERIFREILDGKYQPGSKLPTEVQTAELTNTSRITVRRAFEELENAGIIHRTQGRGTFVSTSLSGSPGRSDQVALLTRFNDPFALEFVTHLERQLAENDSVLILKNTDDDPEKEKSAAIEMVAKGIRNLVIWPSGKSMPYETFFRLRVLGTNIVFFDRILPGVCADYVGLDHKKAMLDLLRYAQNDIGEFVFVNYENLSADSNIIRQETFEKFCMDNKFPHRVEYLDYLLPLHPQIRSKKSQWFKGLKNPGVFCVNDSVAIAIRQVLGEGLQLFGIDGFPQALDLGITTVAQPISKMAKIVIERLQLQREKAAKWKAQQIYIEGKLITYSKSKK